MSMKLSEAMSLGCTMSSTREANWQNCALGIAANAVGLDGCHSGVRLLIIGDEWPWLVKNHCYHATKIMTAFDTQVLAGTMTMEELIAYVRSVEPQCDCNTFGCCCARIAHLVPENISDEATADCIQAG